jgi:L-alanine-DL-glutamate epimerase-like enolase superfamily enzyme
MDRIFRIHRIFQAAGGCGKAYRIRRMVNSVLLLALWDFAGK